MEKRWEISFIGFWNLLQVWGIGGILLGLGLALAVIPSEIVLAYAGYLV